MSQTSTETKDFKLIIAGSRTFNDYALLCRVMYALADVELADKDIYIVSGMARGADRLGYHFAQKHGCIPYEFPADWKTYGKRAGYLRNEQMGNFADGLLAFWDGQSRGTQHMINYMKRLNKPVWVITFTT